MTVEVAIKKVISKVREHHEAQDDVPRRGIVMSTSMWPKQKVRFLNEEMLVEL